MSSAPAASVWSPDDSKTVLLVKEAEKPRRQSKVFAIMATVLGLGLVACLAFHNQIFNGSAASSPSSSAPIQVKAPIDDCIAVVKEKLAAANTCTPRDAVCGCDIINSFTSDDIAVCPPTLADGATGQAIVDGFTTAKLCCNGTDVSTCDSSNIALYGLLAAQVPGSGMGMGNGNGTGRMTMTNPAGYTSSQRTATRTAAGSPNPTPSNNGVQGMVPSFILGLLALI